VIDLLFASSGIEPEVVAAAEALELLANFTIPVARTGHLIALKILSRDDVARPQDLVDLRALLRSASPTDLAHAREGSALIAARGYHRDRDLISAFATLVGAGHRVDGVPKGDSNLYRRVRVRLRRAA
jgi:hypothetical protein